MSTRVIQVRKSEIPVHEQSVPVGDLAFYPQNPRINSQFSEDEDRTQELIFEKMRQLESVKELRDQIDYDGQINEPLYVVPVEDAELADDYEFVVLEGNSRLAAVKLQKPSMLPPIAVPCWVLDFSTFSKSKRESLIFSLLGQLHLRGKKDWSPYEDAAFFYRHYKDHSLSLAELADESGVSIQRVRESVRAYELMIKHDDQVIAHFSYYLEYAKAPNIKKHRENHPNLDSIVSDYIKNRKIEKAAHIRKLPKILGDMRARKKFLDTSRGQPFDDALDIAELGGSMDATMQRIKKFRQFLADHTTKKSVAKLKAKNKRSMKQIDFELKKIARIAEQLGQLPVKEGGTLK